MDKETEELLQRWLKIEIAKFKWSIVTRVLTIGLLIVGLVMGARIVEPIVTRQLQILNAIQGTFLRSNDISIQSEPKTLFEYLEETLTPEQKHELQMMMQQGQSEDNQ